jgi:hypothetical protein
MVKNSSILGKTTIEILSKEKKGIQRFFLEKGKNNGLTAGILTFIVIFGLIGTSTLIMGCTSVGQPPEEAAIMQFIQHLNNKEYSQAADMAVNANNPTDIPTDSQKQGLIGLLSMGGARYDNVKILSKEKISDNQYVITTSQTVTSNLFGTQAQSTTTTRWIVVQLNGKWMIAV